MNLVFFHLAVIRFFMQRCQGLFFIGKNTHKNRTKKEFTQINNILLVNEIFFLMKNILRLLAHEIRLALLRCR